MEIRTDIVNRCLLCGSEGKQLYADCQDYSMGVPGKYGFHVCHSCGLVWLNPRPVAEDIIKCYPTDYYTHQAPENTLLSGAAYVSDVGSATLRGRLRQILLDEILKSSRQSSGWKRPLIRILASISAVRLRAIHFFNVTEEVPPIRPGARLLEVGCGGGLFLAKMKNKGWQVFGVDMDSRSARVARESFGIDVFAGHLREALFPDSYFDAIVMKHVIEHAVNPLELFVECFRVLAPGGWIGIITPNIKSLGHKFFTRHWFALEIPRHLHLFSPSVLSKCVQSAGFEVILTRSQANMARDIYEASVSIREKAQDKQGKKKPLDGAKRFDSLERLILKIYPGCGEEIVLLARKGVRA